MGWQESELLEGSNERSGSSEFVCTVAEAGEFLLDSTTAGMFRIQEPIWWVVGSGCTTYRARGAMCLRVPWGAKEVWRDEFCGIERCPNRQVVNVSTETNGSERCS